MKSFEDKLTRLEEINRSIKDREIGLEDAVKLFEEGMKLSRELEKDISKVERKIEIMVNKPEDPETEKPELDLFSEHSED